MIDGRAESVGRLHMIVVDVAADSITCFTAVREDANLVSVRDAKQFLIIRSDKANATLGFCEMLIQPRADIAVVVKVILTKVRIQAHHHRMIFGIHSDAVFAVITEAAFWMRSAVCRKAGAVSQDEIIAGVGAQCVDDLIEKLFELRSVQVNVVIVPRGKK